MADQRILIVEDEPMVAEVVERYLRRDGYDVRIVHDGRAALDAYDGFHPDLVVLDLMLPEVDGLEVCRRIRAHSQIPVLMLTAKGEEIDKLLGLELGADDYVTKPFSPRELAAREFDMLFFLASHPGQVFTRDQLMDAVWDYAFAGDASTVTVHMRRLRSKVEVDPSRPRHLKTVWGVGDKV